LIRGCRNSLNKKTGGKSISRFRREKKGTLLQKRREDPARKSQISLARRGGAADEKRNNDIQKEKASENLGYVYYEQRRKEGPLKRGGSTPREEEMFGLAQGERKEMSTA